MICPKCNAELKWGHHTQAQTLDQPMTVDVIFEIGCTYCDWSAQVTMTNTVSQEDLTEIYLTEEENGD